jgi:single-stranded-DNA-specific exonuclease
VSQKHWQIFHPISDDIKQQFPELHPAFLQLLYNRGHRTQEQMDVFLEPNWDRDTYPPEMFSQMHKAVACVFTVLTSGGVITIHGDYDADGVCGSAVLITTLREISRAFGYDEQKITSYIPHREKEGYGMSVETVEHLRAHEKTTLVITVDCGISNKQAIDRGRELGIDTIVCDHHTMPEVLPEQAILIHPLMPNETFPNKNLCGTGVAFKLACALYDEARKRGASIAQGHEKWLLDLVAIATVTDLMPLVGENRVLETFGLRVLNKTRRVGLKKLIEIAGGKWGTLDTVSIGFQIGPRLNAAGRMNHASEALHLLIEEDELRALELAMRLNETNMNRQRVSKKMYEEAYAQVAHSFSCGNLTNLIIAVSDSWSPGLVGLVAGKLVGDFNRPTYVIGKHEDLYIGSGRTVGEFDVTAALHAASAHLEKFGGHPQACGFSIRGEENLQCAIEKLHAFADEQFKNQDLTSFLQCEMELTLEQIDWGLFDLIECMRPFGRGNEEPFFCARDLSVVSFSAVGADGKHLKLNVKSPNGRILPAIAFGFGSIVEHLSLSSVITSEASAEPRNHKGFIDLVFHIRVNEWNGNRELQLYVEDMIVR